MSQIVHRLMTALANKDAAELNTIFPEDAYLQIRNGNFMRIYCTRSKVYTALMNEFARWENQTIKISDCTAVGDNVTVAFQFRVLADGRLVKPSHYAMLTLRKAQVKTMILYRCDELELARTTPHIWSYSGPSGDYLLNHGTDGFLFLSGSPAQGHQAI